MIGARVGEIGRRWLRRVGGVLAMGLVAAWVPAAAAEIATNPATPGGTATPGAELTVVSYNIHHGAGEDGRVDRQRLERVLQAGDADVLALQEVDQGAARSGSLDWPAALAEAVGMEHRHFAPALHMNPGKYGNLLISRVPLRESGLAALRVERREPRVVHWVRLDGSAGLTIANLHLAFEDEASRVAQLEQAWTELEPIDGPLLLLGDFNAEPGSATLAWLAEHGFVHLPKDGTQVATSPADQPRREIDHAFLRGGETLEMVEHRVLDEAQASDHRPILLRLRVRPGRP